MPVRRVVAHEKVGENRGKVALERGPLVYCAEWPDNDGRVLNLLLPDDAELTPQHRPDLLGGVSVLEGKAVALRKDAAGEVTETGKHFVAIPYYAWCHRGPGQMAVWLARERDAARPLPPPTIASMSRVSFSHLHGRDAAGALHDQIEPEDSNDHEIPRFTWWDHKGTTEWVQYDFLQPTEVSGVAVYWFDDTGRGQCRVPESWRLLYRDGDDWKPVPNPSGFAVAKDQYNEVSFGPVTTTALRLEVELQPEYSGGILEWRVDESS